ncbi:MAG: SagB/ThcOx family dehydrogenase [Desulfomonilia bacterium]|jgi:SagB-type dehydrogenase family enzyme
MDERIGERFQRETMYDRRRMPRGSIDLDEKPPLYKTYPQARKVPLPPLERCGDMSLHEALLRRKSLRRFLDAPISLENLSCLMWASSGIQRREMGFAFRTAPSAGALYPLETYVVATRVSGLEPGVYHYQVKAHQLEELKAGDFSEDMARAALGQEMCSSAAVLVIYTAIFRRTVWKYRQRGYRYVYIEAGHMAQNLALASISMGLGCCHVGALFDGEVNEILGVDGIEESVVYLSALGQTGMYV